jgi:hypothetical protein
MVYTDREQIGFTIGSSLGTILYAPINLSALIYGFRYLPLNTALGTIVGGTIIGELLRQRSGTITGTIDVIGEPTIEAVRDSVGESPIAVLGGGDFLVGQLLSPSLGSIIGVMSYEWVPVRVRSF